MLLKNAGLMLALPACWVRIASGVRKAAVTIAACWPRMLVLDSSERGLERSVDYPVESAVFVLRVTL